MATSARGYGPKRSEYLVFDGDENNYEKWEVKLLAYLSLRKLKKTVTCEGGNDAAKNEEAFSEIVQLLDDRSLSLVMRDAKDDGRQALKILREHYAGKGKPRVLSMWTVLSSLVKTPEDTITDYLIRAETAANALRNAGQDISDSLLVAMVMKGLPKEFRPFNIVLTQSEKEVTFAEFKVALRSFEENERASFSSSRVMYNNHGPQQPQNFQPQNFHPQKPTCHKCGREGHKANNCNQQFPANNNHNKKKTHQQGKKMWCSYCKTNSHTDKSCRRQQNNNGGRNTGRVTHVNSNMHGGPNGNRGNNNVSDVTQQLENFDFGFVCKVVEEAPADSTCQPIAENSDMCCTSLAQEDPIVQQDFSHDNNPNTPESKIIDKVKSIEHSEHSVNKEDDSLLVDSGASEHIFNDDKNFIEEDKSFVPENHFIELADGSRTQSAAKKKGKVRVNITDENGVLQSTVLHDVLYCPNYPQNIFSVKSATKKGAKVMFSQNQDELQMDGSTFPISTVQGLYFLYNARTSHNDVQSCSLEEWHKILGHCNKRDVLRLEQIVDGMKITDKTNLHCEACVVGKQTENKSRKPDPRALAPLDFVHSDVAGPIEPVAKDGHRYVLTFTDDFSSSIFAYFLKTKDDATEALRKFIADSAPYGKLKRLRTDNGGEYLSKEFEDVLLNFGIKHEGSAPYCPHQNGTAERGFRTLFEMARCMILDSDAPRYLWTFAVMTAVRIRNSCFNQRTGQTPYFLLTGRKPNLKKMKIFGTVCYAHIHGHKQKLDPRSQPGIFVGYDKNSASYLVYFAETRKVKKCGMVTFTNRFKKDLDEQFNQHNNFQPELVIMDADAHNNIYNVPAHTDNHNNVPAQNDNVKYVPDYNDSSNYVPAHNDNFKYVPAHNDSFNYVPAHNDNANYVPADNEYVPDDNVNINFAPGDDVFDTVNNYDDLYQDDATNSDIAAGQQNRRYPSRSHNKPQYLQDYVHCVNVVDYFYKAAPKTYNAAVKSDDTDKWYQAMLDEMNSLIENDTFDIVELPKDKTVVGGRWVYAVKESPDNQDIYKARYVAKGFNQTYGVDYFSTFAPTTRMSTIRMVIQIAVNCNYLIHQMDVKSAYLNAPIDCEVYMEQPKGFEQTSPDGKRLVYKLKKSLYGLKQSAHNWKTVLCDFFSTQGCKQSQSDQCVYIYDSKGGRIIYVVWVDDIIIAASSLKLMELGKNNLKGRFKMKDLGPISKFLGIKFTHHPNGSISMDQTQYLLNILHKFGMDSCKPRSTPCELKADSYYDSDDQTVIDEPGYRAIVGSLIYAMTCTRPDLSWIVSKLSQHLSRPTEGDWTLLKQVMRYLKGTSDFKMNFSKTNSDLRLVGYSDADWASSVEDRRSTTGYYFQLNVEGPAISWKSRKQQTVALSTCEAEYMALCETSQEALYLQRELSDLCGYVDDSPTPIYGDNQGSLDLVRNPVKHNKSKHIDIKYHFIRDLYTTNKIDLSHVRSDDNIADIMTKPLPKCKYDKFYVSLFGTQMN